MIYLSSIFPQVLKDNLKGRVLRQLHAKPEITYRIATRIIRDGLPRYLGWTYKHERETTLRYVESMRTADYAYKFASSSLNSTLYSSIYACMLLGMHGQLDNASESFKKGWLDYFDSFQDCYDGFFRDPALAGPAYEGTPAWGDGWGIRHLAGHILIAYARLGQPPRNPLKFLEPFYDADNLSRWLNKFDFSANVWSQSNYIMNIATLLQYARDYMSEERAAPAVETILQWLMVSQRADTGLWHTYRIEGYPEIGDAIRGAYHYFPLFSYEGRPVRHREAIIDTILASQNSWGAFNSEECPSGACEDIDAIEPIIRSSMFTRHRRADVERAIRVAMVWVLACRNEDGGFESMPEHAFHYGEHSLTTSQPGESNLFATWFRSLCLAYMVDFLAIPNFFSLGRYPGYEISLGPESLRT